jgi:CheY-like chemotaxis protein
MDARILVTMEHSGPMKLVSDSLEQFGHNVTKSDTFHGAMEFLRSSDVDLIISDVHLQNGGSVFDFLRWVKGDPHMHAIPFVCFSAEPPEIGRYLADGVRTAARALGAAKYISMEHFDSHAFRQEIEWLLPQSRAGSYYAEAHIGSAHKGNDGDGKHPANDEQ